MNNLTFRVLSCSSMLWLLGCGSSESEGARVGRTGSLRLPLVAQSASNATYRLDPARFRVTGQGVDRVFSGGGVDVLNVDLAPATYSMNLLADWKLNLVADGMTTPIDSVLQSPNPQSFIIEEGVITDIVYTFGVGPDQIAFGMGRGRVLINVNDGTAGSGGGACVDPDGDGYGEGASCIGPDCNQSDASVHPGAPDTTGDQIDQNCDGAESCFADADGDSFRTASAVSSADMDCSDPGEATGAAQLDCCDVDANVNPAAAAFSPSPTACGGWDYNCDGIEELRFPEVVVGDIACFGSPPCFGMQDAIGFRGAVPSCGQLGTRQTCNQSNCSTSVAIALQECR
jgi:Putative metal-binding motif